MKVATNALMAFTLFASPAISQSIQGCESLADIEAYPAPLVSHGPLQLDTETGWIVRAPDADLPLALTQADRDLLSYLSHLLESRYGSRLAAVIPPPRALVAVADGAQIAEPIGLARAYAALLDSIEQSGVIAARLDRNFVSSDVDADPFYLKRDTHWSADGAVWAGSVLAEAVFRDGLFAPVEPEIYSLNEGERVAAPDRIAKMVEEICEISVPVEDMRRRSSVQQDAPQSSVASLLFEEVAEVPIVALGTSFSNKGNMDIFRWTDALQVAFQQPVLNMAIENGGVTSSFKSYAWHGFDQDRPSLVIWETPYNAWQKSPEDYFRDMIGDISPRCVESPFTLTSSGESGEGQDVEGPRGLFQQTILEVKTSNEDVSEVTLKYTLAGEQHISRFYMGDRLIDGYPRNEWRVFLGDGHGNGPSEVQVSAHAESGSVDLQLTMCSELLGSE